jgi:hypothetical protein
MKNTLIGSLVVTALILLPAWFLSRPAADPMSDLDRIVTMKKQCEERGGVYEVSTTPNGYTTLRYCNIAGDRILLH